MLPDACTHTVSILHALVLGTDGACIDVGLPSILPAVLAFVVVVVALRYGALALLIFATAPLRRLLARKPRTRDALLTEDPLDSGSHNDDGPIRSTRRR